MKDVRIEWKGSSKIQGIFFYIEFKKIEQRESRFQEVFLQN